ncbi:MAG: hypothetical protein HZA06_01140 [Nitrospirae bacterium]|nr:hypothetical protein [Nitrospirota bacterium]
MKDMKDRGQTDNNSLSFIILYLIPSIKAVEYIPPPLKVVNVLPGYTAGGFYISCNLKDSERVTEFACLPAYTQYEKKRGFFYNPLAASKNLWPLQDSNDCDLLVKRRKNSFHFEAVSEGRRIISLDLRPRLMKIPLKINYPFLMIKGSGLVFYRLNCTSNFSISTSDVDIPEGSPFNEYPFKMKILSGVWENCEVLVNESVPILGKRVRTQLRDGIYGRRANSFKVRDMINTRGYKGGF